jgi:thymidine phosphorylase
VLLAVPATRAGFVTQCNCRALGMAVVGLGGGRLRASDSIDSSVGLTRLVALGDWVQAGQPLAVVHARSTEAAQRVVREVQAAYTLGDLATDPYPCIHGSVRA